MAKFPEAENRLFKGIFVCRKCKSKLRSSNLRVISGKVRCRKCHYGKLKPVRKK